jgi:hypothetical protein
MDSIHRQNLIVNNFDFGGNLSRLGSIATLGNREG